MFSPGFEAGAILGFGSGFVRLAIEDGAETTRRQSEHNDNPGQEGYGEKVNC